MANDVVLDTESFDDDIELLENKFLTFQLNKENYAVNIGHVIEIIEMLKITPMPESDPCMKGVVNLRGKVIPIMDIRLRFGMQEKEHDSMTCIIVVKIDETELGLIVDNVCEVLDIPNELISAPPTLKEDEKQKFVQGMGKVEEEVIVILDLDKVIIKDEIAKAV